MGWFTSAVVLPLDRPCGYNEHQMTPQSPDMGVSPRCPCVPCSPSRRRITHVEIPAQFSVAQKPPLCIAGTSGALWWWVIQHLGPVFQAGRWIMGWFAFFSVPPSGCVCPFSLASDGVIKSRHGRVTPMPVASGQAIWLEDQFCQGSSYTSGASVVQEVPSCVAGTLGALWCFTVPPVTLGLSKQGDGPWAGAACTVFPPSGSVQLVPPALDDHWCRRCFSM